MRVQLHVRDLLTVLRVYRGQPTVAIAHPEAVRDVIVTDIVGIVLQLDGRGLLQRRAVIQSARAVLVVGHGQPVGFRGEADSLRRTEVPDVLRDLARR